MMFPLLRVSPLLAVLIGGCGAIPKIEAADPTAAAPPVVYRSELVPLAPDEEAVSWRAANDEMRQAGGHGGHVKTEGGTAGAAPGAGAPVGHVKTEGTPTAAPPTPAHKH